VKGDVGRAIPNTGAPRHEPDGLRAVALVALLATAPLLSLSAQTSGSGSAPEATSQDGGGSLSAQQLAALSRSLDGEATWILLERGRIALEEGDPGVALAAFLQAREVAAREVYPEADLALGDFWRAEGDFAQAERAYRRALDDLRIAQNLTGYREFDYGTLRFVLLERLAELFRLRENYGGMEEQYRAIVQADRDFSTGTMADRIVVNYQESGLNKVLALYRLSSGFAVRAYAELGWLYYKNGNHEKAIRHSLFAVTNILSVVIKELRRVDPQYTFVSVEATLRDAYRRAGTRSYLEETEVWKALYYLAAESHAASKPTRAKEIWGILQRSREAGMYQDLASRQLARPWVEPPLKEDYRSQSR
jgi:tetratricopeptide (TPR) repeat protein